MILLFCNIFFLFLIKAVIVSYVLNSNKLNYFYNLSKTNL